MSADKKILAIKTNGGLTSVQTTSLAALKARLEASKGGSLQERLGVPGGLQLIIMFDITGSTAQYFQLIKQKIKEISEAIKKDAPGAKFSVYAFRNHGNEAYFKEIFYATPFLSDINALVKEMESIKPGGGGGNCICCMEECLQDANKKNWNAGSPKAIVIIGDQPPHGGLLRQSGRPVDPCPQQIDPRKELEGLKRKGVKTYSVYCGSRETEAEAFYHEIARIGDGKFLHLDDIDILVEIIIGICMKETDNFAKFAERLRSLPSLTDQQKEKLLLIGK